MSVQLQFTEDFAVTIKGGNGAISNEDFQSYWQTMMGAFTVYVERETIRQGLWKDYPAEDQFNQIKIKIDRVIRSLERLGQIGEQVNNTEREDVLSVYQAQMQTLWENILEETKDIINYAHFGARQLS